MSSAAQQAASANRRHTPPLPAPLPHDALHLSPRVLAKLQHVGFCLREKERIKYIKTVEPLGQGSYGKVREAYRQPSAGQPSAGRPHQHAPYASSGSHTHDGPQRSPHDTSSLPEGKEPHSGYMRVAIKEIDLMKLKDEAKRLRVVSGAIREARLLRRVRGAAHLIQSFRPWYNARRGRLCFPMEMADMDLLSYMRQTKYNPPAGYLLSLAKQMLLALQELHDHRIVHRDVKLENFLVFTSDHQGQPPTIKLADFGLSATEEEAESSVHERVGTPYFMAPECYHPGGPSPLQSFASTATSSMSTHQSEVLYARDVWGLGCILFIMVNGALPFPWDSKKEPLECVLAGRRHLPSIPRWAGPEREVLHQLALRCMEVDLNLRPTVSQLLQELHGKVQHLASSTPHKEVMTPMYQMMAAPTGTERAPKLYQLMRVCRPGYTLTIYSAYPTAIREVPLPAPIAALQCGEYVLVDCEFELPVSCPPSLGSFSSRASVQQSTTRRPGQRAAGPAVPGSGELLASGSGSLSVSSATQECCTPEASAQGSSRSDDTISYAPSYDGSYSFYNPGAQRWAKIVYPVRGFCRSEENGHHVFHPYHHSEETCPRLGLVGKPTTEAAGTTPRRGEAPPPAESSAAPVRQGGVEEAVGGRPVVRTTTTGEASRRLHVDPQRGLAPPAACGETTAEPPLAKGSTSALWDRFVSLIRPKAAGSSEHSAAGNGGGGGVSGTHRAVLQP